MLPLRYDRRESGLIMHLMHGMHNAAAKNSAGASRHESKLRTTTAGKEEAEQCRR